MAKMEGTASTPMTTQITGILAPYFDTREKILFAVLFGSVAKGTTNTLSDIDIAVMIAPDFKDTSRYGYRATLTADLMQRLKRNDVDVIVLNKAPILLNDFNDYMGYIEGYLASTSGCPR